mgnify:CR=1 FL=1
MSFDILGKDIAVLFILAVIFGVATYFYVLHKGKKEKRSASIVNIKTLCDRIFCRVSAWYNQSDLLNMKYTRTFDMTNSDDVLLYRKLCEEERAKRLMEDFKKENENK